MLTLICVSDKDGLKFHLQPAGSILGEAKGSEGKALWGRILMSYIKCIELIIMDKGRGITGALRREAAAVVVGAVKILEAHV